MRPAVIFCLLAAAAALAQDARQPVTLISSQPRQRVAVLPTLADGGAMNPQGQVRLADKVREIASKTLPLDRFILLKQDAIVNMVGEEELYRSCKEGVCIGDLTKKVSADYGVRCEVFQIDNSLALKFELYSVDDEAILETFTEYKQNDFYGMLAVLDSLLPGAFKKMTTMSKNREVADVVAKMKERQEMEIARERQKQEQERQELKLAQERQRQEQERRELEIAMEQEKQRQEAENAQKRGRKRKVFTSALCFDIAGAGIAAYGLYENAHAERIVNDGEGKSYAARDIAGAKKALTARNAAYIIGGALLAAGLSIHIAF